MEPGVAGVLIWVLAFGSATDGVRWFDMMDAVCQKAMLFRSIGTGRTFRKPANISAAFGILGIKRSIGVVQASDVRYQTCVVQDLLGSSIATVTMAEQE
jgi:hypothetical protein